MRTPFLDLRRQFSEAEAETEAALRRVLVGGAHVLGREVEAFEDEWALVSPSRWGRGGLPVWRLLRDANGGKTGA